MKWDFSKRFGFLVNEIGRLYSRRFDQLSREQLGLSRAQCRLLGMVATHDAATPLTQAELAHRLDLTPMGVTSLCDRMESAGWIQRQPSSTDRRANSIQLQPIAEKALHSAVALSDAVQAQALQGLSAAERKQLLELLRRVQLNLHKSAEQDAKA